MKGLVLAAFAVVLMCLFPVTHASAAQVAGYGKTLCRQNERVITSFPIEGSKKIASVCADAIADYVVYRFGRPRSVELQFPEDLSPRSWDLFDLQPDIEGQAILSFENKGQCYEIMQKWKGRVVDSLLLVARPGRVPLVLQSTSYETLGRLDSARAEFEQKEEEAALLYDAKAAPCRASD